MMASLSDAAVFLSTPSARRATSDRLSAHGFLLFLSTPSARRATVQRRVDSSAGGNFYPRPPRGGRLLFLFGGKNMPEFLSTPSARRATPSFVSRSRTNCEFLSTPSARRATWTSAIKTWEELKFLSTPSARRATYHTHHFWIILLYFYPRPPRGGRHALPSLYSTALKFLSTPSARRATFCDGFAQRRSRISIHALREEGDSTSGVRRPTG